VPPGDEKSEEDVDAAESGGEEGVGRDCSDSGCGRNGCERADGHEADAHHRDDGDGVEAAGDDSRAVKEQPGGGEGGSEAGTIKQKCKQRCGDERREQAEGDLASGAGEEREAAAVGFAARGDERDYDGQQSFGKPDFEPGGGSGLAGGEPGGGEGGGTEDDLSPAGDGGEGGGTLHSVADEAEIGGGVGDGVSSRGERPHEAVREAQAVLARAGHRTRLAGGPDRCQVVCGAKWRRARR